jgi:ketosteroid isomerase-like protein
MTGHRGDVQGEAIDIRRRDRLVSGDEAVDHSRFASIPEVDDIQGFEPREFIEGGEHVTVLGWERTAARPGGKVFETEWVHVFTVRGGKIVRFWGIYDTEASAAARS